jgi:HSP20 family protein
MVRWYYPSIFDELEEMRTYLQSLSRQMYDTNPRILLPAPSGNRALLLPARREGFRVEVTETGNEVVVRADMMPGVSKTEISIGLSSPRVLEISCGQTEEHREEEEGYFPAEQKAGSLIVPLPRPVSEEGARASLRNGVLEVHLKIPGREQSGKITID